MGSSRRTCRPGKRQPVAREAGQILPEQIERLKELFPEAVSEGRIDFDRLRATLGELIDENPERYSFNWAGKRDCIKLLQVPSRATLIPCPEESVDWNTTGNVFIEGENLEVLKLLYKSYYGRVKMIYIDPPYNTGKDFIYPDNFADPLDTYLRLTGQKDAEGNVLTSNPETSGRYHSNWLSMMYPRLFIARQLLRDDGVIFVSIDDNEVHNLRAVMNEIFGEENFVANIVWQKKYSPQNDEKYFSESHEHLLLYAKSKPDYVVGLLPRTEAADSRYQNPDDDARGPWKPSDLTRQEYRERDDYEIASPKTGKKFRPPKGNSWGRPKEVIERLIKDNRIWFGPDGNSIPQLKRFLSEVKKGITPQTLWLRMDTGDTQEGKKQIKAVFGDVSVFETAKPSRLLQRCMLTGATTIAEGDIVVDFFAGSCAAAHAVLEMNCADGGNRRFLAVQLPEPTGRKDFPTIADIGKERIRRVIAKMKKEQAGKLPTDGPQDLGFRVYKLAESNIKPWKGTDEKDPEKYAATMEMFIDPLVKGWKPEDMIAEVALKEAGFGLNCRVEELNRQGRQGSSTKKGKSGPRIYRVTDPDKEQFFYICLDDKVRLADPKPLGLNRDILFVCRDAALDDETAANLALQCRLRTV